MWLYYLDKINSSMDIMYVLLRTVIIYIYAVFLIRVGNKRFNFETTIDFVLIIIIGAVLSRTINGPSTLMQAISGSTLLIFLHWLFARFSFNYHKCNSPRHPECSEGSACSGTIFKVAMDTNRSIQDSMH
ncbi:hypothetical protein Loa_00282 [Legionella oakridgensis ATCC 33761 = DSM 21215]|uniref:DUF421 domain-containing protein n=1 Tax=Legionella oakridgensis ATCC 33761 = DSM 21215 TaxID=1268635 RepID=W0BB10_9GAMM|nr:membrane protein [Legionella oakridgensis]AHE65871.1 hypothetical protein Loa_00282 [Legionella oakridgensis ATCC 33761 = DSM 21215]STY15805.1 Uncharacterised protein [Legionella longbeachae]